jgi:hypothetical protein
MGRKMKLKKMLKKMEKSRKMDTVTTLVLAVGAALIPIIPELVERIKKEFKGENKPGFVDEYGELVTEIEIDGQKIAGREILEAAEEALRARAKRAREEAERDLDRRVARAVEKALQGKQGFMKATTSQQYGEV